MPTLPALPSCPTVSDVRHILDAARQGTGMVPEPAAKPVGVGGGGTELPRGARPARPSELVELKSADSHGLSTSGSSKQLDGDVNGEVQQPGRDEQQQQQQQAQAQQQGAAGLVGAGSGTAALPDATRLQAAVLEAAAATSGGGSTCSADGGAGMSAAGSGERKRGAPVTHIPEVGRAACGAAWLGGCGSHGGGARGLLALILWSRLWVLLIGCHRSSAPNSLLMRRALPSAECAPRGGRHCRGGARRCAGGG